MKRFLTCALCLLLLFTAACGGTGSGGSVNTGGEQTQSPSPEGSPSPDTSPSPSASPSPDPSEEVSGTPEPSVEPEPSPSVEPEPEPTSIVSTLAVCGDMMTHMPIIEDAKKEDGTYDFYRFMAAAVPYVSAADYAVVNLETTLSNGPNYSGYPNFNAPATLADDLKAAGFDLCLTANNHSLDKRWKGVVSTLDALDAAGMAHVGTSRTQEEADNNCVVADVGGITVAFLGYTYGTNAIPLPEEHPYAVNVYNTDYLTTLSYPDYDKFAADLEKAKATGADLIAVMVHWGNEYNKKQNVYQERVADFLLKNGVDLVLGGHPHVLQPMEMRTVTDSEGNEHTGFVCWSLGNFISSQNYDLTDTTVVLTLELTKDLVTGETAVTGCSYVPMYMLDREEGAYPRFELLDTYAALADENTDPDLRGRLERALQVTHDILGEEYDARCEAPEETPGEAPADGEQTAEQ